MTQCILFEKIEVMKALNFKFTFLFCRMLSFVVVFVIPRLGGLVTQSLDISMRVWKEFNNFLAQF